ncbi:oxidoreductase [Lithospermum erythrorhizon]|uniref:NADPH-dependent diflavin oxidoreductase 1 n=1 Tax=Lithospermum erythrorhizon TaxID=34254 RepID=A0AAV3RLU8_LITER
MGEKMNKILVLYATQSGNAFDAAERIGREAERRGCPYAVLSVDDYDPKSLGSEDIVIFVVSTTGQGDAPDSLKSFWRFLLQSSLRNDWLKGVNYAVFGLGDSGYQKYNFVAKKLDNRLSKLGAKAIIERGLGDDQHPSGYEGALDPWLSALWNVVYELSPSLFPNGLKLDYNDISFIDQPKVEVVYHDVVEESYSTTKTLEMQIEWTRTMSPGKFSAKTKPECFLKMKKNSPLSRPGSGKDVCHLEFEAVSSSIEYEVGDVIEVLPSQDPAAVDAFIKCCELDPEAYITVLPRQKDHYFNGQSRSAYKIPVKLKTFVALAMDVASASPRRYFFEVMSYFASAEHEKERLRDFVSPEGRDDLYQYNQKEGRTVLEVLEDFPSVRMPFEWLVQLVPPLKTRAFSIASSNSAHPNEVHLTVSVVSWMTPYKRKRFGLCSTWLANLDPQHDTLIPAWFRKGLLPPPPPSLPLILIGPGTGCAPFRGFVEERALQGKSGLIAPILFFFGCRNEADDFLYRDFWYSHSQTGGVLSEEKGGGFYVAFSRDQPQKVYVQHKIREQGAKVWSLLAQGASIYVAGSAEKMPADVLQAFEEIISKESGFPREEAGRWLRAFERAGRYHVEAWS